MADELIIALSRFRWLACIPCAAAQSEPGMDYLLDGSVQRSDDRLRVLLRVMDLNSCGKVVWAERFDHRITDIFTLQDRLASTMAAQLEPGLWLCEGERVGAGGIEPRTAQDLLRLAVPALHRTPGSGMPGRQRATGQVVRRGYKFGRRRTRADPSAAFDDRFAAEAQRRGDGVPSRAFAPQAPNPRILGIGPVEFQRHSRGPCWWCSDVVGQLDHLSTHLSMILTHLVRKIPP
ncbi:MAG TPA: hypothetical protein VFE41_10605 [Acetobacteraceae bacterium]|nr:hypothetical protein [Acetobacteraceae bacterium]